jgi:hypothetical protein
MKKLFIIALYIGTLLLPGISFAKDPPFNMPPKGEVLKIRSAIVETSKGKLFIELFPEEAPWHVTNFKYLADKNFYGNLTFQPSSAIATTSSERSVWRANRMSTRGPENALIPNDDQTAVNFTSC